MKLVQYAISSIVDANTGYLQERNVRNINYQLETDRAHRIRARSLSAWITAVGGLFSGSVNLLRDYLKRREALARLSHLDDHLLRDIGLTREDVIAAENGEINADDFLAISRAEINKPDKLINARQIKINQQRFAANDHQFNKECCA